MTQLLLRRRRLDISCDEFVAEARYCEPNSIECGAITYSCECPNGQVCSVLITGETNGNCPCDEFTSSQFVGIIIGCICGFFIITGLLCLRYRRQASSPGVVINTGPRFWVSSGRNLPVAMMATPVMIGANPGNISMAEVVDQSKPSASPY